MTVVVLAQAAPGPGVDAELWSATASAVIQVVITNRGADTAYRVALVPDGGVLGNEHYLVYDEPLEANRPLYTDKFAVPGGASVWVRSTSGSVTFSANGLEE
jgi:hypothetical protein